MVLLCWLGRPVIRDGKKDEIPSANVVPGDVVVVKTGDQVPADLRLFWQQDVKVEMSSLTGEPAAISRAVDAKDKEDREVDASNLMFSTGQIMEGEAYGICYATGDKTLIGRIAGLASSTVEIETPLQHEVDVFVKKLAIGSFAAAVAFFIIGVARGQPVLYSFINGFIVVAVACVPEGNPSSLAVTFLDRWSRDGLPSNSLPLPIVLDRIAHDRRVVSGHCVQANGDTRLLRQTVIIGRDTGIGQPDLL